MTATAEPRPAAAAADGDSAPLYAYSDVEYVFKPHDNSLPEAREYIQSVWDRRDFIREMASANVKQRGAGTVLGKAWGVIDPLFQAMIYWFLFNIIRGRGGETEWLLIVISGVFFWNLSSSGLNGGGRAIQRSKGLVLNSTFPLALLPISNLYKAFLDFLPTFGVYMLIHLVMGGPIGVGLTMLPFLFVLQMSMTVGLSLIFATLTVYIKDMTNLLDYVMRILFFMTPIIYPVAQLNEAAPAPRNAAKSGMRSSRCFPAPA